MLILGICGGPELAHEDNFGIPPFINHDSACVLVEDGRVRYAIEEERLNRIKHTNKFPFHALQACLDNEGLDLSDVDCIAYYSTDKLLDMMCWRNFLQDSETPILHNATSFFQHLLEKYYSRKIESSKFCFVHHHHAHAMSAFALSGYENSLVITIDGEGDNSSGMVFVGKGTTLNQISNYPARKSLGYFYLEVIRYIGYH